MLDDVFAVLAERRREGEEGERDGLDMRYLGQAHFLTVLTPSEEGRITVNAVGLRDLFTGEYDRTFGSVMSLPTFSIDRS